jgi:glycosyltransferase involved in cell wall biosynthesis
MSASRFERKALVLSPIASHPQDYGNRNRILQMTRFFKDQGYEIHFVFYPIEPDWSRSIPPSAKEMREAWDSFTIVPPSRPLHQLAIGEHHQIDEWWDPVISHHLDWLFKREFFDLMLVNYTYFSKAFEHAPRGTVKVLEMHDLFSGRKEMFAANGVGPDFFYTLPEQERIAFERADVVIAIKDGEAKFVRGLTPKPNAIAVPFYMPEREPRQRPGRLLPSEELRVGFLGANNLVNLVNMRRFLESYLRAQEIYVPNLTLDVAGNVCSQLQAKGPGLNLLGRVERIEDFYDNVDVVIAPLMFSTGIKIKVGEALSFGKPVVATENGFDGYAATDKFHALKSYDDVARALVSLSFDRERLMVLENRSALAARMARRSYEDGCRSLSRAVRRLSKMIVLVTDQPIWSGETAQQERLAQWIQLFAYMGRAVVLYVGSAPLETIARGDLGLVKFVDLSGDANKFDAAVAELESFDRTHHLAEIALSVEGALGRALWERLAGRFPYLSVDLWVSSLADIPPEDEAGADVWVTHKNGGDARSGLPLSLNALRYEPYGLAGWTKGEHQAEIWIARCGSDAGGTAAIELIRSALDGTVATSLVDLDVFAAAKPGEGFESIRGRPVPSLILAMGSDRRAAQVWRCVAQQAGIAFLHLHDAAFPLLLPDEDGSPVLCASYGGAARHIAALSDLTLPEATHSGDTGWHTYWNMLWNR